MRKAFTDTLTGFARANKNIFLLTGDLGFSVFEGFKNEFPDRFYDVGVAEQNMIGLAAGLSMSGKRVFVYSIIPFATMRCFEQIRNDLCMQNQDVKIVGVGAGLHYGTAGSTHYAAEDISIMKSLPNMKVFSPATQQETVSVFRFMATHHGPMYVRLGKACCAQPQIKRFFMGRGVLLRNGSDISIISTGSILSNALEAGDILAGKGISVRLINIHTIKPIDKEIIMDAIMQTKAVFTLEEHSIIGGLGDSVAAIVAESGSGILFRKFGLPDAYPKVYGERNYMLKKYGLSSQDIVKSILKIWQSYKDGKTVL
ncbi:MAG: 1-deoxy-D-xylulose-5-phosphate synthase [Candidatus Omnitrophica bacterium CG_4_8_14_3_um_filter_43_15]|nr:MAG: 1-deoxy-D-xylulose-5-phosphate synthase [Candidatus Omnitrophica bacterium CG02_land_8_20_14_3_00__42_8]PIW80161.1 MAG: 1-deoxy-D-xylulose-5-phosphate synthase [Candidatus Omnitrophica bacterium CG_4_8_14_3_um_filter_43_15]